METFFKCEFVFSPHHPETFFLTFSRNLSVFSPFSTKNATSPKALTNLSSTNSLKISTSPKSLKKTFVLNLLSQFFTLQAKYLDFSCLFLIYEVSYETNGFLVKNKDTIYGDLIQLMEKSTDFFVQTLFPAEKKDKKAIVRPGQPVAKKVTLGTQFKVSGCLATKLIGKGTINSIDEYYIFN